MRQKPPRKPPAPPKPPPNPLKPPPNPPIPFDRNTDGWSTTWQLTLRQSVFSWQNWAALRRADAESAQAEADFRKALDLSPDQPQVLNYLGYSYVEKGQNLEEALSIIERA